MQIIVLCDAENRKRKSDTNNCSRCAKRKLNKQYRRRCWNGRSNFPEFSKGIRNQQAWIHDEDSPIVVDDLDDADIANSDSVTSLERERWNQFRGRSFHNNKHKCCRSCKYRP